MPLFLAPIFCLVRLRLCCFHRGNFPSGAGGIGVVRGNIPTLAPHALIASLDYNLVIFKKNAAVQKTKLTVGIFCRHRGKRLVWGSAQPQLMPLYITPFGSYSAITPAKQVQGSSGGVQAPKAGRRS